MLSNFFHTLLSTSTSSTSTSITSLFKACYENTLHLGDKEASGRVILGIFMELVRETLQERHPKQKFDVDLELKVLRFSSDAAIIVASTGLKEDVVFSVEYKPRVSAQLEDQRPFHLSELFLQAFYLAPQCEHAVVHCLTDLEDYHMFLVGKNGKKICIKKYWYRKCDLMDSSQTAEHLHFLSENIPLPQEALVPFGDT